MKLVGTYKASSVKPEDITVEEDPEEEVYEESNEGQEEVIYEDDEEDPEGEIDAENKEDPEGEIDTENKEDPEDEIDAENEEDPEEEIGAENEEDPEEEIGAENEDPEEGIDGETEEDPVEEVVEEPEEDPEEEIGAENEEDPEEEIDGETEEDPVEEVVEEPEEDPEEEIDEETEEDPVEEVVEEPEEDPEEEIDGETEEDPVEEVVEELEVDAEEEINEESGEEGLNRKDVGDEACENLEEKRGSKSSGKCRKSRWDLTQEGETREIDGNNKRRKTRWDSGDSQNGLTNPSQLELLKDPETIQLRDKLIKINKKLQSSKIHDAMRHKLIIEKNQILSSLAPSFQSPSKLVAKVLIPEKEYPSYNFVGLILGPKGNTQKKMEKETGAKILLRGKGSGNTESEGEDLHVRVEANSRQSLNAAEMMIKKLLVPVADLNNDHKRAQLMELAKLRGTYKDNNIICDLCKEQGHLKYACPLQDSTFKADSCEKSNGVDYANLYVGYLPHEIDEKRLRELFVPFGKIMNTAVIKDQTSGVSKGYGFVKFENRLDADAAIKYLNGYKIGGKMLAVRVAGQRPTDTGAVSAGTMFSGAPYSSLGNGGSSFAVSSEHNFGVATSYSSSSGQDFSARIPSLPDSVSSQFPGDPEHGGSQLFVDVLKKN